MFIENFAPVSQYVFEAAGARSAAADQVGHKPASSNTFLQVTPEICRRTGARESTIMVNFVPVSRYVLDSVGACRAAENQVEHKPAGSNLSK